jgi:hypothetical protein
MKVPLFIASDFNGLIEFLIGVSVALLICSVLSLFPAKRGHWSALLVAAPSLFLGSSLLWSVMNSGPVSFIVILIFAPPPLLAFCSVLIWMAKKLNKTGADR